MFGPRLQQNARRIAEMVVRPLAAIGMTPNMATLLGLLLNGAAAAIIASGSLRLGGLMLLFAGLFDMVDGALARVRNQKTTFGAFFDSTLDRYAEGLVLLGVILYALTLHDSTTRMEMVALTYLAALSSLLVSYARARAEGLGLSLKSGLMARPERVLLLAVGLLIGGTTVLLWTVGILAVTSTFTAIQRIVTVWRTLARDQVAGAASPEASTTEAAQSGHAARDGHEQLERTPPAQGQPRGRLGLISGFANRRDRSATGGLSSERPVNR
jgi:CDP-diacylglycerol--glycerol-3-phosphate 3-phosphatidyltransferase